MSTLSIHRELLRKELRQLSPLIIGILLLAGVCYALFEFQPANWRISTFSQGYILLAIPALFAVGAGAMSVSQEKETRTIHWLSALPLSHQRLITTKFVGAMIVWGSLWLVVLACFLLIDFLRFNNPFPWYSPDAHPVRSYWIIFWILHSLYLLVVGFLTAWRFSSSMISLIVFVPLAIAPSLLRFGIAYLQNPFRPLGSSIYDATLAQALIAVLVGLVIAAWFMQRFARASLAPTESQLPRNPYASTLRGLDVTKQSSQSVLRPTTAMLWQFIHQNKTILVSILVASAIGAVIALIASNSWNQSQRYDVEPWVIILFAACISWMGVLAFQGDNLQERIRFLSERGVRPAKVWLTRLLIPFSFAGAVALLYALLRSRYQAMEPEDTHLPVWLVFLLAMMFIGYSHWLSQLVRNPILGAIGAPLISAMAIACLIFSHVEMGTPKPYLVLILIAPFIATSLMMRRWMDRRLDWRFWLCHLGILAFAAMGPLLDLGWYVARYPNMPQAMQAALRDEAKEFAFETAAPQSISFNSLITSNQGYFGFGDLSVDQKLTIAEAMDDSEMLLQEFERQSAKYASGIRFDDNKLVVSRVITSRVRLQRSDNDKDALTRYQDDVKLLFSITKATRTNRYLQSQEQADLLEIALLSELLQPDAKERVDAAEFKRYVRYLADSDLRNEARRTALIVSWADFDRRTTDGEMTAFGNYWWPRWVQEMPQIKLSLTWRRHVNHLTKVLLELLEVGPTATEAQKRELLANRLTSPALPSAWATWALGNRVDDPRIDGIPTGSSDVPGDQWLAGWEQVARDLEKTIE